MTGHGATSERTGPASGPSPGGTRLGPGHLIEPSDFVADPAAFVDVRIERSQGKASYSFIGPGVSQNTDQVINVTESHGFQVGAASMPAGVINNPHLHFTAEVFICTRGAFRITIGEHGEQELDVGPGTVFSAPTWVFRGFQNIGDDDSWLFAVLGGDDTGGILWAPHVLAEAAATGLHLDRTNAVLDALAGDDVSGALPPLTPEQAASVDRYDDDELAARAVGLDDLSWSDRALLSSALEPHRTRLAPVIGHGMTEDRSQRPPITNPHGFSLEWLEVAPGSSTGRHRHDHSQVLLLLDDGFEVELGGDPASANGHADPVAATPAPGSVLSIPAGTWRDVRNRSDRAARAVVVCGSDAPTHIEWEPSIVGAAHDAGWALDASGYLAPADLVSPTGPRTAPDRNGGPS